MATNGKKDNSRQGSVKNRTQIKVGENYIKRDSQTGKFMDKSNKPFKGVAKEPDGRKNKKN